MTSVCIYQGKKYINSLYYNNIIEIRSDKKEDDTYNYCRDIKGCVNKNRYCKEISINEVDDFYCLNYWVIYKGHLFIPRGMGKSMLKCKKTYISTEQYELVNELGLEPCDRMEYGRFVTLEEIDCLVVEKTYLIGERKGQKEKWKTDLIEYLSNIPDSY